MNDTLGWGIAIAVFGFWLWQLLTGRVHLFERPSLFGRRGRGKPSFKEYAYIFLVLIVITIIAALLGLPVPLFAL